MINIESDRLVLKEIGWKDLNDIHRLHSFPEVDKYNTLGIPKSIDDTKDVIRPSIEDKEKEDRSIYCWTIRLKENDVFIGLAGMTLSARRFKMAEIYYKFLPEYWGKGYATETSKALVKYGFEEMKLHRIEAGVATGNKASVRVLEKTGMTNEGIRRKILPIREEWKDNYHFAILESDKRDY